MLRYVNNFNTALFVLHEIYGVNEHVSNVCCKLSRYFDIYCPDFLNGLSFNYNEEATAYTNFYHNVGFDNAFKKVKGLLEKCRFKYKSIYVLGYSVGATIAWLCSNKLNLCDKVVGFYGSRIRDYLEVMPTCPVLLFFPTEEHALNVESLLGKLEVKKDVSLRMFQGMHGFADPFSKHYVEESCKQSEKMMLEFFFDGI